MIQIKNPSKWVLPVYRKHLTDYDKRLNVFYGGAGSGKSYFVCQKMILKALRSKRKVFVVRKVGRTIRNSIWELFQELLMSKMPQLVLDNNKSEMSITLVNGSKFIFSGLDDAEKIKSIQGLTDIIIEEATEITADDFTQLDLRLRSPLPNNQIYLMFNPVSKANWCYKYFFEDGAPEDCVICQTTYEDNPYLPKKYIKALQDMKKRNPAYYKIYAKGEFATLDKLVFPVITVRLISEEEKEGAFFCGLDFGYTNDPTAMTWGYMDAENERIMITGEYNQVGLTNDKIAEAIKALGMQGARIVADSAEPKSIAELKKMGIKHITGAAKGKDSVINGIDKLQRFDIIIDERCVNTIDEFENYTWQKDRKTGEYINEPIDDYNHHIDALRYGIQKAKKPSTYRSIYGGV